MKAITLQDYKQRLLRVLVHIQQQLDRPLSLEELARLAHFSPFHFHRVFKGMLGESVQSHLRRLRLERSAARLKSGDWPVTRIALDSGFETPEAFTRAFKAMFGASPSRYRARRRPPRPPQGRPAASGIHYHETSRLRNFKAAQFGGKDMKVTIQTMPSRRVAFVHQVGPYSDCSTAWDILGAFLGKEGLLGGDSLFIGICHDDPEVTPPDRIRYDACVTVDDEFVSQGEIGVQTIPGGEYAVATHFGSYETLGESYARLLGQWLPRSGRELRATPGFEIYVNDPNSTEPEDLLTDIHLPLQSAKQENP
jgi:AraC family transcriptional regulator